MHFLPTMTLRIKLLHFQIDFLVTQFCFTRFLDLLLLLLAHAHSTLLINKIENNSIREGAFYIMS